MKRILKQNDKVKYELSEEEKNLLDEAQSDEHKSRILNYLSRIAHTYNEKGEKLY